MTYSIDSHYEFVRSTFRKFGPQIFTRKKWWWKFKCLKKLWFGMKHLFGSIPWYSDVQLRKMLVNFFDDKKLSDIKSNALIVVSTNLSFECPQIFTNLTSSGIHGNDEKRLVDVGLYTSAAPFYFKARGADVMTRLTKDACEHYGLTTADDYLWGDSILLDGGLLENMPIISTYVTIHQAWNLQPEDIDVLVIGTGKSHAFSGYSLKRFNSLGKLSYGMNILKPYLTESNEQTSVYWGEQMGFHSFKFFNPITADMKMDDPEILDEIDKECEKYKEEFIMTMKNFLS